jgi:hypothetical protein
MVQRSETYNNHKIVVDDDIDRPMVTIDGTAIQVVKRAGRWFTPKIAFNHFETLEDLARNVIDHGLADWLE